MEAILEAVKRSTKGKNEARRLRASGKVPAVVYGAQKPGDAIAPVQVAVSPKEMMRILHSASGVNTLITLNGPGESTQKVLVREFQLDPVTQALLHADFYRVNLEKKISVKVPVVLVDADPAADAATALTVSAPPVGTEFSKPSV